MTAPTPPPAAAPVSRRSFLVASSLTVGGLLVAFGPNPATARAATPSGSSWMSALPGTRRLSELSIPGTHDSGSTQWGPYVACQSTSIDAQLAMGARFLDIRVNVDGGAFQVFHGGFDQGISFKDVLESCRRFLAANPGETVLLCMKQESTNASDAEMSRVWTNETQGYGALLVTDGSVHTLGEVRGKVVVVSRNRGIPGMPFSSWDIEDHYSIGTASEWRSKKWPFVRDHLAAARANRGDGRMWVTFTSCTGWALTPRSAANLMTPALTDHLLSTPARPAEREGIVLLDFATPRLVEVIGARNFGRSTWA